LPTLFKNFLNNSTNAFKLAQITLNCNTKICYFLVFCFFFDTSPGTLLPDHICTYFLPTSS
jgi:hypothetical protein